MINENKLNRIRRKIKEISNKYIAEGYNVIIEPQSEDLPQFLKSSNYLPDIIAMKKNDNIIIEIKESNDKTKYSLLENISDIINDKKNWRFEFILSNPKTTKISKNDNSLISDNEISMRISNAKSLINNNIYEPAFLLLISVLEAGIRKKISDSIDIKFNDSTKSLISISKTLYSYGNINKITLNKINHIYKIRNEIVHGYKTSINKIVCNELLELTEQLLSIGRRSEIVEWIEELDLFDYNEIYALSDSVSRCTESYPFKTKEINDSYQVESMHSESNILLQNDSERELFIKIMEEEYMDGYDKESYYGIQYSLHKDD